MKKWKTLASQYIYKTPYGNLRKDRCLLPNGFIIDGYYVNEYADWVNAVVLTKNNTMVFVKQYRHAADEFFLEITAGKKEENETYLDAIKREVREETGYISLKEPIYLGKYFVNPATQTNCVHTYLFIEAEKRYEQDLDQTEVIEIFEYSVEEVMNRIQNHGFNHLLTVSAIQEAILYLKKEEII